MKRELRRQGSETLIFRPAALGRNLVRALRPHQWLKNVLVFVPLLASHRFLEPELLTRTALAFVAFCLFASGAYFLNDLWDLESDRRHPVKRLRPFASGQLPLWIGLAGSFLLVGMGGILAWRLGNPFFLVGTVYVLGTIAYSMRLRRELLLDVLTLAILYTIRIVGGVAVTGVEPSNWLFAFSGFSFLGLALMKRYAELISQSHEEPAVRSGRGYQRNDAPTLQMFGVSSCLMAALVMALYIENSRFVAEYRSPALLWLWIPLLVYYFLRMWLIATRGHMTADPILFAIKDRITYLIALLGILVFFLAL